MDSPLVYKIALSLTKDMSGDILNMMNQQGLSAQEFFSLNMTELSDRFGGESGIIFQNAVREEALFRARKEYDFISRHSIRAIFIEDEDYPFLLKEIPDAPLILYVLGNADLNSTPALSVVGTRRCTAYGTNFCKTFISDLAPYYSDAVIVSGLAFGIDTAAHVAALESGLKTFAVLAHGLDKMYPAANRELAKRILNSGGALISEYPSGTTPYRNNFLQRNRIVAGLSEATLIVESEARGGAMSTANLAFSYSREVFALPGRCNDLKSEGCNSLISKNKAHIFTSLPDFLNVMNWKIPVIGSAPPRKSLFPELEGEMAAVYKTLHAKGAAMAIDEIRNETNLSMPALMAALTDLEFEGIITKLPGARYELC